jgi:hypothetical protein
MNELTRNSNGHCSAEQHGELRSANDHSQDHGIHMFRPVIAGLLACMSLPACATSGTARMSLPPSLQKAEAITLLGLGHGRRGRFVAGPYKGEFERSAERLAFFDRLIERQYGTTRFSLAGPDLPAWDVTCRFGQRTHGLGVLEVRSAPLAFKCEVRHQGRQAGELELKAISQGLSGMMMRQQRRGSLRLGSVVLDIRSAHHVQGSPLQLASPLGYLFELDGSTVGAVQTDGRPFIRISAQSDEERHAVIIGALALALLWDPATLQEPLNQ